MNIPSTLPTRCIAGIAGLMLSTGSVYAEDKWQYELTPYLWVAGLDGTAGIGPSDSEVSLPSSAVFDNLEAGFLGHFEAHKDQWGWFTDVVFLDIKMDLGEIASVTADVDQLVWEVGGTYKFQDGFDLIYGVRYIDLTLDVGFENIAPAISSGDDWIDPFIGGRIQGDINSKWGYSVKGDIGGFGVGSDLSWHIVAGITWQAWSSGAVIFAYKHLDMDYEDGSGRDRFKYDMASSGPAIGVQFQF